MDARKVATIMKELNALRNSSSLCLQGLLNCEQRFQLNLDKQDDVEVARAFRKTCTQSEVFTYTFLFIGSLIFEKLAELAQLEGQHEKEQKDLASEEEVNAHSV